MAKRIVEETCFTKEVSAFFTVAKSLVQGTARCFVTWIVWFHNIGSTI